MRVRQLVDPQGRVSYALRIWRLEWETVTWSLTWLTMSDRHTDGKVLFSAKCVLCRRFTLGCSEHWFCDLCELCRKDAEADA